MNNTEQHLILWLKEAEQLRREKPSFDSHPLPDTLDYAVGLSTVSSATAHLQESITNGQQLRTEAAARALIYGAKSLADWLRAKGYHV